MSKVADEYSTIIIQVQISRKLTKRNTYTFRVKNLTAKETLSLNEACLSAKQQAYL